MRISCGVVFVCDVDVVVPLRVYMCFGAVLFCSVLAVNRLACTMFCLCLCVISERVFMVECVSVGVECAFVSPGDVICECACDSPGDTACE